MNIRKIKQEWKDKEIIKYINEYESMCGNRLQQCLEEIQGVKDYFGGERFDSFCEMGVDHGGTLYLYSRMLLKDKGEVLGIDSGNYKVNVDKVLSNLQSKGYQADFIQADARKIETEVYDIIHLDMDSNYEDIKIIFEKVYDKAERAILMHDTMLYPGLIKFREYLERRYKVHTFFGPSILSGGFGPVNPNARGTGITLLDKRENL